MPKDYYQALGVARDATAEEIKRAFRRVARETHPDTNPGDPETDARFREAAEAYEVLSDPDRRRRYDRGDSVDLGDLLGSFGGFEDLLRSVFGDSGLFGAPTRQGPRRGRDVLAGTVVDLAEAAFGTATEVTFRAAATCDLCGGSGAAPGSRPEVCPTCRGSGSVRVARRSILGSIMSMTPCLTCGATGRVIRDPCERCLGEGLVEVTRTVAVEVPPGVTQGSRLRLTGRGEGGVRGGPAGDLYVEVQVRADSRFIRDGDDLVHQVGLDIAEAALGTEVKVPLLEGGEEVLAVPPGTQPGDVLRLAGLGVTRLGRRSRGDLLVRIEVRVPTELSLQAEEGLRAYAAARGTQLVPPRRGRKRRR
jgi:molecular chaperone DnaJ